MAQVNITLTIHNLTEYLAVADAGNTAKFTNTMLAVGQAKFGEFCVTNAARNAFLVSDQDSEQIMFMPTCSISLAKTVACGPAPVAADFGPTVTALRNAAVVYRYLVTNTGTDTLNNVRITDDKITSPLLTTTDFFTAEAQR